jgi:hypothetical protein
MIFYSFYQLFVIPERRITYTKILTNNLQAHYIYIGDIPKDCGLISSHFSLMKGYITNNPKPLNVSRTTPIRMLD